MTESSRPYSPVNTGSLETNTGDYRNKAAQTKPCWFNKSWRQETSWLHPRFVRHGGIIMSISALLHTWKQQIIISNRKSAKHGQVCSELAQLRRLHIRPHTYTKKYLRRRESLRYVTKCVRRENLWREQRSKWVVITFTIQCVYSGPTNMYLRYNVCTVDQRTYMYLRYNVPFHRMAPNNCAQCPINIAML